MAETILTYSPAYNSGADFSWSSVTFSSTDGGLTYTGSPTTTTGNVPNRANLTNVTIGNIVISIGSIAFQTCQLLSTVTFAATSQLTSIGSQAFQTCSILTSIEIPASLIIIGQNAFQTCSLLATVTFLATSQLISIEKNVFDGCNFASINIPISLQNIGNNAFQNNSFLSSFSVPSAVVNIGTGAFANCTSLTNINVNTNNPNYSSIDGVLFNKNKSSLIQYPIAKSGSSYIISKLVTTVLASAFTKSTNLTSVRFEKDSVVGSIGITSFAQSTSLVSINIPNTVTSIGTNAFQSCSALTTVYISNAKAIFLGNQLGFNWSSPSPPQILATQFYNAPLAVNFDLGLPTITSISPSYGNRSGGELVTISGVSFSGTTATVTFDGISATNVVLVDDITITATTPAHAVGTNIPVIVTVDGVNSNSFPFEYILCFKEGTKILTDKGYMLIQDLRKGDLVKTVSSDFKKIEHIGYSKMYHNANNVRSKNKLYRCPRSEYPELFEDLIITGCHSILVKQFKDHEQMEKTQEVLGKIYITDVYYRLPACVDDRTKIFEEEGVHTIWHFSLENSNYYCNYGIYANGLLVESTSNRMMVEISGMTLLE